MTKQWSRQCEKVVIERVFVRHEMLLELEALYQSMVLARNDYRLGMLVLKLRYEHRTWNEVLAVLKGRVS